MRRYFEDAAVLARKDLRLELRARDTLPAMLLFVIAILVVFHFALPSGSSRLAELGLVFCSRDLRDDPRRGPALGDMRRAIPHRTPRRHFTDQDDARPY